MPIKIYNTMTRKKEEFVPLEGGKVRMYVCGITPYDYSHIGHARSCVAFDVIRRWLEYRGYEVVFVQNFTDVDDKIINRALKEGKSFKEVSEFFIKAFFEDIVEPLNIKKAHHYPKVTEHIKEIVELIEKIIERGHAYVLDDGTVYFHVPSFKDYGKLSKQNLEELKRHRIEPDSRKRDVRDFALWKAAKDEDYKVGSVFDSPWGKGRPGWHIECSAMSMKYLGETLDIHGGGKDLIFPHHENEIAQSEAATGKTFVRYWMHNEFVTIKGEKMSKSLGNIVTMRELLQKYDARVLRFFLASVHYRDPVDFDEKAIKDSEKLYRKLENALEMLDAEINATEDDGWVDEDAIREVDRFVKEFEEAMDDDFDASRATRVLVEFASFINKYVNSEERKSRRAMEHMLDQFLKLASVLGIFEDFERSEGLDVEEMKMIEEREKLRKERRFEEADRIRDELRKRGVLVFDTPRGVRWRKISNPASTP